MMFLKKSTKSNLLDTTPSLSVNQYGKWVERFDLKGRGQLKFSYLLHHARNIGYDAIRVKWERLVLVCTNGLTKIESAKNYKWKHTNEQDIFSFVNNSINEGVALHLRDEVKIDDSINRELDNSTFSEFLRRLHLANVSKHRLIDRIKTEVHTVGNNEWALSQALTWIGTHAKEIDFRPKDLLKEDGSMILDHSLENYLQMEVYTSGFEKAYGPLLPV